MMARKINVGLVTLAALAAAAAATTVLADPSVDRRAGMGFMGMRGKKDGLADGGMTNDETSAAAVELDKRTLVFRRPLFGGDRAAVSAGTLSSSSSSSSADGFKRAMGFMGMRGKKDYYKGSATAAGFFGMRGKKAAAAAAAADGLYYGARGQKSWPYRDVGVERAVLVLRRIIDDLRTDREQNFVAANFDEESEIR